MYVLRLMYTCMSVCVPVHRCTEKEGGASRRGRRHIVLITSPISTETHPFPICCRPPVKRCVWFYNNSKGERSCSPSWVKGAKPLLLEALKDSNSGVACCHRGCPVIERSPFFEATTPPVSTTAQQQFSALFSFKYEALFTLGSYQKTVPNAHPRIHDLFKSWAQNSLNRPRVEKHSRRESACHHSQK